MTKITKRLKKLLVWVFISEFLCINGLNIFILNGQAENNSVLKYELGDSVYSVDISFDGQYFVAGSGENVYLFNRTSIIPLLNFTTQESVRSVSMSSNGTYFTAGSDNGRIYLFDRSNSTPLWYYYGAEWAEISSCGQKIVAAGRDNYNVYFFIAHPF